MQQTSTTSTTQQIPIDIVSLKQGTPLVKSSQIDSKIISPQNDNQKVILITTNSNRKLKRQQKTDNVAPPPDAFGIILLVVLVVCLVVAVVLFFVYRYRKNKESHESKVQRLDKKAEHILKMIQKKMLPENIEMVTLHASDDRLDSKAMNIPGEKIVHPIQNSSVVQKNPIPPSVEFLNAKNGNNYGNLLQRISEFNEKLNNFKIVMGKVQTNLKKQAKSQDEVMNKFNKVTRNFILERMVDSPSYGEFCKITNTNQLMDKYDEYIQNKIKEQKEIDLWGEGGFEKDAISVVGYSTEEEPLKRSKLSKNDSATYIKGDSRNGSIKNGSDDDKSR